MSMFQFHNALFGGLARFGFYSNLMLQIGERTSFIIALCGDFQILDCCPLLQSGTVLEFLVRGVNEPAGGVDCQHFFRQIFLGYFSDIVQAFDTLRKNVCGDDYTSLHNPIVLSSVLPAYGMFHSIQILFL